MFQRDRWTGTLLVVAATLLGCGSQDAAPVVDEQPAGSSPPAAVDPASGPEGGPYDADAQLRPDLMRAEPAEARPGEEVQLHFPEETERGVAYVLEERADERWQLRYYLSAAAEGYPGASAWAPRDEEFVWDDIGIGGPGPDRIVVPSTAGPGEYRVCTANAGSNFCIELAVME